MEKLTEKINDYQYGAKCCGTNCKYNFCCTEGKIANCKGFVDIIEKLAEYEKTDLSPNEINSLSKSKQANEKLYILDEQYRIGIVKYICTCDQCKERGEVEIFIDDLEGRYLDCIKLSELNSNIFDNNILTCGDSVQEIINYMKSQIERSDKNFKFSQIINNYLNKIICENKDDK